ncbi:MAG: YggS family pyridoxal phosphate-dependent enzyme [Terriglobales bacterium]
MSVKESIDRIRERLDAAARKAGREPRSISLMAVSKTVPHNLIGEAYDSGIRLFGESRVQEFEGKAGALRDLQGTEWHMIGHLQTNKAAKAVELFSAVDSVDSMRLAEKLNASAQLLGKKVAVLIEINVGGELAKSGVQADSVELEQLLQAAAKFEQLEFRGLMTVPPFAEDPEQNRRYFRMLRELRDSIGERQMQGVSMDVLSMGMSHDFEVAIEEGSTCVRVGTAIFGDRTSST